MSFTVFIEKGLHAGAVQRMEPGLYTIGSDLSADIMLSDPDVLPIHVVLEMDEQGLRLEPAKGSVAIDGETAPLEPGDERSLSLPATFHIGDAVISIRAPKDAAKSRQRKRMALTTMAMMVLGVAGLYIYGPLAGSSPPPPGSTPATGAALDGSETIVGRANAEPLPRPSTHDAAETEAPPPQEIVPEPVITVDMAAAELRGRLASVSLDAIDVMVKKDHLVAEGTAEPLQMRDWQAVQIWFDGAFGRDVPLVPRIDVAEKAEPPELAIEAVWAGQTPYLVAGGQRYFEGKNIGDGWTIEQIKAEQIILRRGDQTFSITL